MSNRMINILVPAISVVLGLIVGAFVMIGFGYDPMFYVEKFGKTFGEISKEEKNEISHRRMAMDKLKKELEKVL